MTQFPAALPHGPITEVFPDVFHLTGGFRIGAGVIAPRNMTIVRDGQDLTIINSVRLTAAGEDALAKLGKVKHLVRIGSFHGADDPYYVQRYQPVLWAPDRMKHFGGLTTTETLRPDHSPVSDAKVFLFDQGALPEAVMVLEREGGVIVACDSFQNWTSFDGASFLGKLALRAMRFGPAMIGPMWAKKLGPGIRADFDRLLALEWRHALSGHGAPVRDAGKQALRSAIAKFYREP